LYSYDVYFEFIYSPEWRINILFKKYVQLMRLTVRAVVKTGYQKIKGSKFLMRSPTENCHENRKMHTRWKQCRWE